MNMDWRFRDMDRLKIIIAVKPRPASPTNLVSEGSRIAGYRTDNLLVKKRS
jgi:hypothetical protein